MRVLLAQINPTIGDFKGNRDKIIEAFQEGRKQHVDLVLVPEMAVTGYPPEDLLLLPHFLEGAEKSLDEIIRSSSGISAVVGIPRRSTEPNEKPLLNSAAIIQT